MQSLSTARNVVLVYINTDTLNMTKLGASDLIFLYILAANGLIRSLFP